MMIEYISGGIAIAAYLWISYFLFRSRLQVEEVQSKNTLWLSIAATAFHGLALFNRIFLPEGLNMSLFYSLSLVGWLASLLMVLAAFTKPVMKLGIVVFPLAALLLALQFAFPGQYIIAPSGHWQLQTHILFSLFASSILYLAAMHAVLLHFQDSSLHKKHPGGFIRTLPALTVMEDLLFEIITLGFLLLSAALVTGFLFVDNLFTHGHAHKTVLSILAWLLFGILLFGRYRFGWRGRRAISWTIGGFGSLVLAYFGTKLVLEIILHRTT